VKAARARRDPDLARRAMSVDDDLRAVVELDFQDAARLELEVGLDAACLEGALDFLQRRACQRFEFGLVHGVT
jgi:hypothetical protein